MQYGTVITNGRWFDGTGGPSAVRDIGVRDGRIVIIAKGPLDTTCAQVIDATGQWVIPDGEPQRRHRHSRPGVRETPLRGG